MRGPIEPKKMTKHGFGNCSIEDKGNDKVDGQNGQQLKMLVTGKNWVKKKQKFSKPIISQQNSKKNLPGKKNTQKNPQTMESVIPKPNCRSGIKNLYFLQKKMLKAFLKSLPWTEERARDEH